MGRGWVGLIGDSGSGGTGDIPGMGRFCIAFMHAMHI